MTKGLKTNMNHFICIDIGGTAIKYGLIDEQLCLTHTGVTQTPKDGREAILSLLEHLAAHCLTQDPEAKAICISTAGIVDSDKGYVLEANEELMPGYTGAQIQEHLSEKFHLPCSVENDVNCAALAEYHAGAAKGCKSSLTLTIGTGIGGAFIFEGMLLKGHTFSACEVGYMHMDNSSSFEQLGATSVLVSNTARTLQLDPSSINGKWIFEQAAQGNAVCQSSIRDMCQVLSKGIANLCYVLNPEIVVIGGGISSQSDVLGPLISKGLETYLIPPIYEKTRLAFARHKNHAGMMGAYLAYRSKIQ